MFSLSACLEKLLSSLPPHPIPKDALDSLVEDAIAESKQYSSSDNRRSQWEYLLRNEIYKLAGSEGALSPEPDAAYYDVLCDKLDVVLAFTEHEACDSTFVLSVLQDLLETQTVASCSHVFSWIESRSARLTEGMVPQKGKALLLLRTLNDLLRRLSKTGNNTTFCGRILTFLSAVFPLSDRSGVNLRGDYGPQWEPVTIKKEMVEERMDVDEPQQDGAKEGSEIKIEKGEETQKMDEDQPSRTESSSEKLDREKKEDFYNTFWSLQLPFSRPMVFATDPNAFAQFKSTVDTIMPVIKEATIRERAMMGSRVVAGSLKRKQEPTPISSMDEGERRYFFAKFLTSPDLLDLEVSDTQFRRQILFQILILLTHLLQFTAEEKQRWATPRNRSLQMDFTLHTDDVKWVQDTIVKVYDEMRQTTPNSRAFTETVQTILEREKNWMRWKNDLCAPFDKPPLPYSLEEETAPIRETMRGPMEEYPHKLGSEALSEIWAMGYRDLRDLENSFSPGDVKDIAKSIEKENGRVKLRKQQLEKQAQKLQEARARAAAASPAPAAPSPQPTTQAPAPAPMPVPIAPVPQRPPPLSASSPPLHPSLPAKPGTQPVALALPSQPSPAPPAPSPQPALAPAPAVVVRPPAQTDPLIVKAEEAKQRLSWLALRLARDEYLHLFGKIGNGDVGLLVQEIEKEKERFQRGESLPANPEPNPNSGLGRGTTPSASDPAGPPENGPLPAGDTKLPTADSGAPAEEVKSEEIDNTVNRPNATESNAMPVDS